MSVLAPHRKQQVPDLQLADFFNFVYATQSIHLINLLLILLIDWFLRNLKDFSIH